MIRIFKDWNKNEPTENQTMEIAICVKHIVYSTFKKCFRCMYFLNFISYSARVFFSQQAKRAQNVHVHMYVNLLLGTQCNVININVLLQLMRIM